MTSKDPLRAVSDYNARVTALVIAKAEERKKDRAYFREFIDNTVKTTKVLTIELAKAWGDKDTKRVSKMMGAKIKKPLFENEDDELHFNLTGEVEKYVSHIESSDSRGELDQASS